MILMEHCKIIKIKNVKLKDKTNNIKSYTVLKQLKFIKYLLNG